jgi:hypothetical protein
MVKLKLPTMVAITLLIITIILVIIDGPAKLSIENEFQSSRYSLCELHEIQQAINRTKISKPNKVVVATAMKRGVHLEEGPKG